MIGILDIILNFPGFHRWKFTEILRNILKIALSLAWCVVLPLCDAQSNSSAPGMLKQWISFLPRDVKGVPPLHILAVALCLLPNVLTAIMFIFPMLRRWIENSVWHIIRLHVWWSQSVVFCLSKDILSGLSHKKKRYYNVDQIGQQVHGGAPVMFWYLRFIGFVSATRGKSHHIHDPMKESQHRERQRIGGNDGCSGLGGISNYSPKSLFPPEKFSDPCCFRISAGGEIGAAQLLRGGKEHIFVEAANAFLRRSKAKRSVMSSDTVFSFFYREVVDAQKEVSRQGKD
ncbi:hypothetical protein Bca52824_081994 [Brassica carinata]|uniref:Uncharacterized protein n=1 Tax=Brassica carinata TaxID=52824 RepID=A0A8X7PJR6_BRACI|nr:hypothetical protein Bca52824_081994 [Brassica carinata]